MSRMEGGCEIVDTVKGICMDCHHDVPGAHNVTAGILCLTHGLFKCKRHFRKHKEEVSAGIN